MQMMVGVLGGLTLIFTFTTVAAGQVDPASMVAAHNEVRGRHGLPPLVWSKLGAKDAAKWADYLAQGNSCRLRHAKEKGQGENLFWASAVTWSDGRREIQRVSAAQVVKSWASERADYDYEHNTCRAGKVCGHYTQIVWKRTAEVGCARRICDDQGQIWVCRYLPPGNWRGEKPY